MTTTYVDVLYNKRCTLNLINIFVIHIRSNDYMLFKSNFIFRVKFKERIRKK